MKRRGMMFVLSSPSGAGKTTLSRLLLERHTQAIQEGTQTLMMSVSVTTRPKRPSEVEGRDYRFVAQETFEQMVARNELLEYARVFDHYYGTPATFVEQQLAHGVDVLFDIDWQGTHQLSQSARGDLVSVFILPPSMQELERRLRARAQDSEEVVAKRMGKAAAEISHWREYDYVLVNHEVERTLEHIDTILRAERLKRLRNLELPDFVEAMTAGH